MPTKTKKIRTKSSRNGKRSKVAEPLDIKSADPRGRVALGPEFASRSVIIEKISETEVLVKLARVIPERELWLYKNRKALKSVVTGLDQAKRGQFVNGPNLKADKRLADQIED